MNKLRFNHTIRYVRFLHKKNGTSYQVEWNISISRRQFDTLDLWTLFNDPTYFLVDFALSRELEIIFRPFRNRHIFTLFPSVQYFILLSSVLSLLLLTRIKNFNFASMAWHFRFCDSTYFWADFTFATLSNFPTPFQSSYFSETFCYIKWLRHAVIILRNSL